MKKRHFFLLLISGLVLMNACLKEHSQESGAGPSQGTLQDDGTGDCFPKTVTGAYVVGTTLVGTANYIDVQVNVTQAGVYTIYTDTVNGIHFRGSGVFSTTGSNTVRLQGFGTPAAVGITNFIVSYGTSVCTVAVNVVGSLAVFTLDGAPGACMNATPAGTYTAGTALDATNTVTIHVTVTTAGAYNISTAVSNGITFSGSGTLAAGAQTIVLIGAGTPATAGTTNIPVSVGGSSCSFSITVGGAGPVATYTINCAAAVINGTYTQNTALTASNTIVITVDVATAGTYTITGTINGMTFSKSGTFASAGAGQSVTLTGTGTPTTSGANIVPLTGGTANCNVTVNVTPAAGAAVFTVNCTSATPAGTYTQNTALTAANTVTIGVNVTTIGTYTISTTANGMTFSASGSFAATGATNVTLNGTGTPNASGPATFNVTAGSTPCSFIINVTPAGGAAVFIVNCASATPNGTYTQNTALIAANTVTIGVNVTTIGTYTISTTANGMTFSASGSFAATGATNVTLNGTGTPNASGPATFNVTAGSTPCSFIINVNPAGGGAAVFTTNCATAPTANGTYTQNVVLGASNTATISVNVTTIGTYSISTTALNGMTFSSAPGATFSATGIQNVTLTGTGTPTAGGMFNVPIPSAACTFLVYVKPGTAATDYFPRIANNNWSYEVDDAATDSLYRNVISNTFNALGNTYNIFMQNDGTGPDSSGYYRRNGGDYFEYLDVGSFIGYDNPAFAEYTMLKDNVAVNTTWTSAGFSGTVSGNPLQIRFSYKILQKDVPITITTSTGAITYQNVIVVEEKYQAFNAGIWVDITSTIDFYGKSYYARGVGLIRYEALDASNVVQDQQELRRYIVY